MGLHQTWRIKAHGLVTELHLLVKVQSLLLKSDSLLLQQPHRLLVRKNHVLLLRMKGCVWLALKRHVLLLTQSQVHALTCPKHMIDGHQVITCCAIPSISSRWGGSGMVVVIKSWESHVSARVSGVGWAGRHGVGSCW